MNKNIAFCLLYITYDNYEISIYIGVFSILPAADYCKKLKSERAQMQNEADILKQEIESLNQAIGWVNTSHWLLNKI